MRRRFVYVNLLVAPLSENRKIGGAACTYRPIGESGCGTCPSSCGIKDLCYAKMGVTRFTEIRSKDRMGDLEEIARFNRTLVRHHVSGDCFKEDRLDSPYVAMLIRFHEAHPEITGWLYTHNIRAWDEAGFTSDTIPDNLVVLASCDDAQDVEYAKLHGWRYARIVLSESAPDGKLEENEVYCPYDKQKDHGKLIDDIKVTCTRCRLCFGPHPFGIVFTMQFPGRFEQRAVQRTRAARSIALNVLA